jgi:putative hydrolase of the HAD superfamily
MIKAIIFDFGRVISAQKPLSLFQSYETELGLAPGSINQIMFNSPFWQEALRGRKTSKEYWHSIGPELGLQSLEDIDNFRRRYHADESINKQVFKIIRQLHGRYKLAVLSNSPPGLDGWLAAWDLLELFDVVFCSGDEGRVKPDPEVYHRTLKRLEVLPSEAVFIDDTGGHVDAARKLGMHGIIFSDAAAFELELDRLLASQSTKNPSIEDPPLI